MLLVIIDGMHLFQAKVVKTRLINGSYYSQALSIGFDPAAPNKSQGYINEVATRALIFIEADEPNNWSYVFYGGRYG